MLKKVINTLKGAVRKGGKRACMIAAVAMLLAACAAVDGVIAGCMIMEEKSYTYYDWRPGQIKTLEADRQVFYSTNRTTCAGVNPNMDLSANDGGFMVTFHVLDGTERVSEYVSMGRCDYGPKRMKYIKDAPNSTKLTLSCSYSKYSRFGMKMDVRWHILCMQY